MKKHLDKQFVIEEGQVEFEQLQLEVEEMQEEVQDLVGTGNEFHYTLDQEELTYIGGFWF
jgi:lipopolysaccharide export system protein LptA